jgi:type II secretory pathway pseudopilin PulG
MISSMRKILIYAVVLLSILTAILYWQLSEVKKEKKRLSNNQEALLTDVETYKTEAGKNAASVLRLELSKSELEKYNKNLTKTVSDLKIKISRIQSAATTATSTDYSITTAVRDSIVYRDRLIPDTLKKITYNDAWLNLDGTIQKGIFSGNIQSIDTLFTIVHRIPKKFLFFKWGTKAIRQEVTTKNPHSKIVYTQYIELKR